jgi:hypothetical protein
MADHAPTTIPTFEATHSRRRFFLLAGKAGAVAAATAGLAGGVVASAALAGPALAAPVAVPESAIEDDPVIALASHYLQAHDRYSVALRAWDSSGLMTEWREKNPFPEEPKIERRPNTVFDFDRSKFMDRVTGEEIPDVAGRRAYDEAIRKWTRRSKAAERRTGQRALEKAQKAADEEFSRAEAELRDAIPRTWQGFAAKTKAFRETWGEENKSLAVSLMRDAAVLSEEFTASDAATFWKGRGRES